MLNVTVRTSCRATSTTSCRCRLLAFRSKQRCKGVARVSAQYGRSGSAPASRCSFCEAVYFTGRAHVCSQSGRSGARVQAASVKVPPSEVYADETILDGEVLDGNPESRQELERLFSLPYDGGRENADSLITEVERATREATAALAGFSDLAGLLQEVQSLSTALQGSRTQEKSRSKRSEARAAKRASRSLPDQAVTATRSRTTSPRARAPRGTSTKPRAASASPAAVATATASAVLTSSSALSVASTPSSTTSSSNRQPSEPSTSGVAEPAVTPYGSSIASARTSRDRAWGRATATRSSKNSTASRTAGSSSNSVVPGMGGAKLLTAADERTIMTRVQGYLKLEKRFGALKAKAVQQGKPEPTLRELAASFSSKVTVAQLAELFEEGEQCKTAMVESNYRLVVAVAAKYQERGLPMKDLVSEGIGGLMRAVEKFDPALGYKFSTYSHWWIRQAIMKAIAEQSRIVRLPAHLHDQAASIVRMRADMMERNDTVPSNEELAAAAGITTKRLSQMMLVYRQTKSLDSPLHKSDDGGTLEDTIQDDGQADAEQTTAMQSLRDDIEGVLHELPVREADVLRMRYGLGQYDATTLEEIGERMNVTRERIRQIESKALRKLRMSVWRIKGHSLEDYDEQSLHGTELTARASKASTKSS